MTTKLVSDAWMATGLTVGCSNATTMSHSVLYLHWLVAITLYSHKPWILYAWVPEENQKIEKEYFSRKWNEDRGNFPRIFIFNLPIDSLKRDTQILTVRRSHFSARTFALCVWDMLHSMDLSVNHVLFLCNLLPSNTLCLRLEFESLHFHFFIRRDQISFSENNWKAQQKSFRRLILSLSLCSIAFVFTFGVWKVEFILWWSLLVVLVVLFIYIIWRKCDKI